MYPQHTSACFVFGSDCFLPLVLFQDSDKVTISGALSVTHASPTEVDTQLEQ
jgi:hypothetical protein